MTVLLGCALLAVGCGIVIFVFLTRRRVPLVFVALFLVGMGVPLVTDLGGNHDNPRDMYRSLHHPTPAEFFQMRALEGHRVAGILHLVADDGTRCGVFHVRGWDRGGLVLNRTGTGGTFPIDGRCIRDVIVATLHINGQRVEARGDPTLTTDPSSETVILNLGHGDVIDWAGAYLVQATRR